MTAALARMSADMVVECAETESFLASYSRDAADYVQSLLQTKICLAPRGGSLETFRVFEGAVAGCVLITDPLPPAWFYAGLPRVELRSWSQLPDAVAELLSHPALMESMSRAGRDWAMNVISPEAIGDWIARCVGEIHR
jgi:glycosyltransferase involved in cell wall biosynthesis